MGDDLVLVILIDEAQTIPLSDRARSALQDLHASHHGCRIVPVLLGLSDTECHVMERDPQKGLGLSRLGLHAVKTIGCLNPAQGNEPSESRQAITGTLKALGMDWAEPGWRDILRDAGCDRNKWTQWRDGARGAVGGGLGGTSRSTSPPASSLSARSCMRIRTN